MAIVPKFRNEIGQKIDAKGRVSVPAAYRKIIESDDPDYKPADKPNDDKGHPASIVIVFGDASVNYLECFTINGMAVIDEKVETVDVTPQERILLKRRYNSKTHNAEIDADGRIILPQSLRTKLGFGEEAMFVGMGDRFEIWKPETYAAAMAVPSRAVEETHGPGFDLRDLLDRRPRPQSGAQ